MYICANSSVEGRNQPPIPFNRKSAHKPAAEPGAWQAARMSRVFCRPDPTSTPRAPGINVRKQPHGAPELWSKGAASKNLQPSLS